MNSGSPLLKTEEVEARRRLRDDLEFYSKNCMFIRSKSGAVQALRFNRAQAYIHERLEEQKAATGKVRALILKGRQQGCSTYVSARFTTRHRGGRGLGPSS